MKKGNLLGGKSNISKHFYIFMKQLKQKDNL